MVSMVGTKCDSRRYKCSQQTCGVINDDEVLQGYGAGKCE
jgi:hypothetical protein